MKLFTRCCILLALWLLMGGSAMAHKVNLFAYVEAGTVYTESYFPDGRPVEDGFKTAYTHEFLEQGYRIIYIGNGASDFAPARLCSHVFSLDNLTESCREAGVACTPFSDLREVAQAIRELDQV